MAEGRPLVRLASHLLNTPIACTARHASMLISALHSRLNISLIEDMEGVSLDRSGMRTYAAAGRLAAEENRERRAESRIFQEMNGVAIIPITGTLTKVWGLEPESGHTGYDGIKAKLLAAMADTAIDAILLDIDSPGGAVSGLFDLVDLIYACRLSNGGKLIWAIANETSCSAAYAIFSAADRGFVTRTSEVGSIGIVYIHTDIQGAEEQMGVKTTIFRAGKRKMEVNPVEDVSEEAAKRIYDTIEEMRDLFIATCARNMAGETGGFDAFTNILTESEGLTYIGAHARDMQFAHEVASEDQVWAMLMEKLGR